MERRDDAQTYTKVMKLPGLKTLDLYIIRKFLGTYLFAIAIIIVILVVFDTAEKMDDFIEMKAPFSKIAFQYYLNFIPFFINQFSGLFTFIAVIFFTSKLASRTEIIAMLAGGVSFHRLMWPYFLSAAVIAGMSLFLSLSVIPAANLQRVDFEQRYLKRFQNTSVDRHIYRQIRPGVFLYIRDYSPVDNKAKYIAIEQYQGNTLIGSTEAADVSLDPQTQHWSAPRYIHRLIDPVTLRETFERRQGLDTLLNLQTEELGRVEELVKTMNIVELSRFISQQKSKGSDMVEIFEVERQSRFTYPMATFILTLIGVSISSRKVRGGIGLHIGIGLGLGSSYILIGRFAEEFAKGGVLPAVVSMWLPNVIFLGFALYLYIKAPK